MSSGVTVSDDVYELYNNMKLKKEYRYMLMTIDGGKIVKDRLVTKSDDQRQDFDDFLSDLPKNQSCYVLLDMTVPSVSGQTKPKLFVITWCPDVADTKNKMHYASSKKALLDRIHEGTKSLQANDLSDLVYEEFLGSR